MEKRLTLAVSASLIGEQGGPEVLKSFHREVNDTQCLLGFFLLCIRHTGQGCRDKMVMVEWRFPVHPCLGMCVGADGQDSTAKELRVVWRDFGGSFQKILFGCVQDAPRREGSRQPTCLISLWFMGYGVYYPSSCLGLGGAQTYIFSFLFLFFLYALPKSLYTASGKTSSVFNAL